MDPNAFRDPISHSRPVRSQGGALVYEVPIKKSPLHVGLSRCTQLHRHWREPDDHNLKRHAYNILREGSDHSRIS